MIKYMIGPREKAGQPCTNELVNAEVPVWEHRIDGPVTEVCLQHILARSGF